MLEALLKTHIYTYLEANIACYFQIVVRRWYKHLLSIWAKRYVDSREGTKLGCAVEPFARLRGKYE